MSHKCVCCMYETFPDVYNVDKCMDCGKPITDKLSAKAFVSGFTGVKNPHPSRVADYNNGIEYRKVADARPPLAQRVESIARDYIESRAKIPVELRELAIKETVGSLVPDLTNYLIGEKELQRQTHWTIFTGVELAYALAINIKAREEYSRLP